MNLDDWIVVPNWDKFQHYKNRSPSWIKLYTGLSNKPEWLQLTDSERGLLVVIWIECARTRSQRGRIKVANLAYHGRNRGRTRSLESLNHAGFIRIVASPQRLEVKEKRGIASKRGTPETPETRQQGFDEAALELAHRWLNDHPVTL